MHTKLSASRQRHSHGFSLVEIAVVLLIVTLLAGSAIAAFKTQTSYSRIGQVREQIREARQALINYAIANKKLPCPAIDATGHALCANNKARGYLPWANLGLPAADPWGQTLRYAAGTQMTEFTIATPLTYSTKGELIVMAGATTIDSKNAIAFAVWSTGEDAIDASSSQTDPTVIAEAPGSDDIVEWVARFVLFGQMSAAGRVLPLN